MKVRELRELLTMFKDDAEIMVTDRTSFDAAQRIIQDPETHPDAALALALVTMGGFEHHHTHELADIRADGAGPMLVITGRKR